MAQPHGSRCGEEGDIIRSQIRGTALFTVGGGPDISSAPVRLLSPEALSLVLEVLPNVLPLKLVSLLNTRARNRTH